MVCGSSWMLLFLRQRGALDQLARRRSICKAKERELPAGRTGKRKLKEELEVVKVISSQLQDLNGVLEKTKTTQSSQSGSMDQIVKSLREELNQAKVELGFSLEDRDKIQKESSSQIKALENQLGKHQERFAFERGGLLLIWLADRRNLCLISRANWIPRESRLHA